MPDFEKNTHPAWGVIQISRVNGQTYLFDSDFLHHNYIVLRICTARKISDDIHSNIMDDKQIVEVSMSETQFARMISSLNMGCGTPCTLERVYMPLSLQEHDGERLPRIEPEDVRETHKDKIKQVVNERLDKLRDIESRIKKWRSEKHRPTLSELDELTEGIQSLHLASNFAFFQEQFEEKMELTIDEGRTEIEAHVNSIVKQFGLNEIQRKQLPESPHDSQKRLTEGSDDA